MRSFETNNGAKQDIRYQILKTIHRYNLNPLHFFTLPGPEMLDVKIFKENFPNSSVIGVERNRGDFQKILNRNAGLMTPLQGTVRQFIDRTLPTVHQDVVFLDYLGALTKDRLKEIQDFVGNPNLIHRDKPCVLAITLQKGNRTGGKVETQSLMNKFYGPDWDEKLDNNLENITGLVLGAVEEVTNKSSVEYYHEYRNEGGVPMYFMILVIGEITSKEVTNYEEFAS